MTGEDLLKKLQALSPEELKLSVLVQVDEWAYDVHDDFEFKCIQSGQEARGRVNSIVIDAST